MERRNSRIAWAAFALLLCAQLMLSMKSPDHWRLETSPGTPPSALAARLASLDEPQLASYAVALYLQGFDAQAGALLPLRTADFPSVLHWLELAHDLNPHSGYPLMLAAFDYAETAHMQDDLTHARTPAAPPILDFVERAFQSDPQAQWHWLAHAAWVSRYVLHDDARALAEARLLRNAPPSADIPRWARELDTFVLGRDDPLQARRALLGGLIASEKEAKKAGISAPDAEEIQRLAGRLEAMSEGKEPNRDPKAALIPPYPKSSTGEDGR